MKSPFANHPKNLLHLLLQDFAKEVYCFADGSNSTIIVEGAYLIDTNISTFTLPCIASAYTAEMMSTVPISTVLTNILHVELPDIYKFRNVAAEITKCIPEL